jgi:hypothetical protein
MVSGGGMAAGVMWAPGPERHSLSAQRAAKPRESRKEGDAREAFHRPPVHEKEGAGTLLSISGLLGEYKYVRPEPVIDHAYPVWTAIQV